MIYIYLGQSDFFLPLTAACLHLDIKTNHPLFRPVGKEEDGRLFHIGLDQNQQDVYIASVKDHTEIFVRGVHSLLSVYQRSLQEVDVIPCIPENPQISLLCRALTTLGLQNTAISLGKRLANNRLPDLQRLIT
jgi:hypothetical protein